MRIPALLLRFTALFGLCSLVSAAGQNPDQTLSAGAPPSAEISAPAPVQVVIPELDQLRNQLRMMERSNEEMQRSSAEAAQKFDAMAQQNSALSNVLTGLQQTLV